MAQALEKYKNILSQEETRSRRGQKTAEKDDGFDLITECNE